MRQLVVFVTVLMLAFPVIAKEHKGKGAGGVRTDHASEKGMEQGKAYAGSRDKTVKEEVDKKVKRAKKEKKGKKGK